MDGSAAGASEPATSGRIQGAGGPRASADKKEEEHGCRGLEAERCARLLMGSRITWPRMRAREWPANPICAGIPLAGDLATGDGPAGVARHVQRPSARGLARQGLRNWAVMWNRTDRHGAGSRSRGPHACRHGPPRTRTTLAGAEHVRETGRRALGSTNRKTAGAWQTASAKWSSERDALGRGAWRPREDSSAPWRDRGRAPAGPAVPRVKRPMDQLFHSNIDY